MSIAAPTSKDPFKAAMGGISRLAPGQRFVLSGLFGSSRAYLLTKTFLTKKKPILAVLPDQEGAEDFSRDLRFFLGNEKVLFYPSPEILPFESQPPHPEIRAARVEFLFKLLSATEPVIAVTAAANLLERVIPGDALKEKAIRLEMGGEYSREGLLLKVHDMGYARMSMVEERGEVSVRGGIIDIFPPMERWPVRVEFFGDEVESIRTFDPSTQRSQKELKETLILPAMEADLSTEARGLARDRLLERADELGLARDVWEPLYNRLRDGVELSGMDPLLPFFYKELDTVFDYLPEGTVTFLLDPEGVYKSIEEFCLDITRKSSGRESFVKPEERYTGGDSFGKAIESSPVVCIEHTGEPIRGAGIELPTESNLDLRQDIAFKKDLTPLAERVRDWLDHGYSIYITAHNRGQAERTKELIEGYGLTPVLTESASILKDKERGRGAVERAGKEGGGPLPSLEIVQGVLSSGFRAPARAVVIVTEEEIFGERVKRRPPPSKRLDTFLTQLQDLKEGDHIVHAIHGIGLYRGLRRLKLDSIENDFLLLE
jgi:transcription-repair coupling factor (superfamily II helicase)